MVIEEIQKELNETNEYIAALEKLLEIFWRKQKIPKKTLHRFPEKIRPRAKKLFWPLEIVQKWFQKLSRNWWAWKNALNKPRI